MTAKLIIALMMEFLERLPDIAEAFQHKEDITLEQIFPKTRAEIEAKNRREPGD